MARVGCFKQQSLCAYRHHRIKNFVQFNVAMMRPFVVAPAQVDSNSVRRQIGQRCVEHLDLLVHMNQELLGGLVLERNVAAHRQVRAIDLQHKTGFHDRTVFGTHRVGQGLQIFSMTGVVLILLEHRQHAG